MPRNTGVIFVLSLAVCLLAGCSIHDYRTRTYVADKDENTGQIEDAAISVNIVTSDTQRTSTKSYQGPPYKVGISTRIPVEKEYQILVNSLSVVGPDGTQVNCLPDGQPFTIKPKGGQIHKGIRRKYWKSAELSFGFEKDKSITVEIELQLNGQKLKKTILYKAKEIKRKSTLKNSFDGA